MGEIKKNENDIPAENLLYLSDRKEFAQRRWNESGSYFVDDNSAIYKENGFVYRITESFSLWIVLLSYMFVTAAADVPSQTSNPTKQLVNFGPSSLALANSNAWF